MITKQASLVKPSPANRIPSLDGLRAISIAFVLFSHGIGAPVDTWGPIVQAAMFTLDNSGLGVLVFFVLSGFLITTLLMNEEDKYQRIDLKQFYFKRIFRIFPAFYSYLLVVSVLSLSGVIYLSWAHILSASLFVQNYSYFWLEEVRDNWYISHFWSLAVEEQFYMFWPISMALLGRRKSAGIAAGIIMLLPVVRVVTYFAFPSQRGHISSMFHTALDPIMVGSIVAIFQGHRFFEKAIEKFMNWKSCLFAIIFVVWVSRILQLQFKGIYSITIGVTLVSLMVALIMLYVIRNPNTSIGKVMNLPILVYIGQRSYSLYLWQELFLTPSLNTTISGSFPVNYICCFIAAEVSYRVIEQPMLQWRNNLLKPSK